MRTFRIVALCLILQMAVVSIPALHAVARPALSASDIRAIATLLKLEDTRTFDDATIAPLLRQSHPEVRRRAVLATAHIADARGRSLLLGPRSDADPDIVATVAFASGQLKDPDAVEWLGSTLSSSKTAPAVALEAARALGKIRTPEARTALNRYLSSTPFPASSTTGPAIGEALLSSGRFTTHDDLAPIIRWITSSDVEIRWRAAWALFRLADPAAAPQLMTLARDSSPEVRYWAVRGLAVTVIDKSSVSREDASKLLISALKDSDRRVRTEAIRALGKYDDEASFAEVLNALESSDSWISVSAAENLGRFQSHSDVVVPRLIAAMSEKRPTSVRITALTPLRMLSPKDAVDAAAALIRNPSTTARSSAAGALRQLGDAGQARLDALSADPATKELVPAGRGGGGRGSRPERPVRSDADYQSVVERLIVPEYKGAARPHTIWQTPRGEIEIELYPGDAPFGVEHLVQVVASGAIVGTEFSRVVPNFVAQQATIGQFAPLRDEVSRIGLTRGNLSWASGGLDTGVPGYTLATAPHPHIEGDFTALGHVVRGLDVIDRLELGDRIIAARMKK